MLPYRDMASWAYSEQVGGEDEDILGETCGIWEREEPVVDTVMAAKAAFSQSFEDRHADIR